MLAPVRLLQAVRPSVTPALLVAIASSTVIFAATPFLLPAIAKEYEVGVGAVGWMSTTQLGGFVGASWVGGRFLRPIRSVFITGALLGVLANLASAIAPTFELLTAARFVSGISLGLAAWIAWQAAFGDNQKTGDVAVVGPLVGTLVAPGISFLIQTFGVSWTFVVLAAAAGTPLLFARQVPRKDHLHPHRTRHASTRAATAILIALGAITLGGSSVFVYGAAIGEELNGLTPLTISLLYSANALVAIPAAKWDRSERSGRNLVHRYRCLRDRNRRVSSRIHLLRGLGRLGIFLLHGNSSCILVAGCKVPTFQKNVPVTLRQ